MVEDLIIVGAGGSAQQIAEAICDINDHKPTWNVIGFLDDDPLKRGQTVGGLPIIGPLASASQHAARFIIGMASAKDPARRRKILEKIGLPRERFATIIHPSACPSRRAKIGLGTAVLQNVVITHNTVVGDHVLILHNVSIGHDVMIEDFVTIAPGTVIAGLARVRAGAYIGAASAINNGRTVNEAAVVGLGAVVTKDVPPGITMVGNPAQALRQS